MYAEPLDQITQLEFTPQVGRSPWGLYFFSGLYTGSAGTGHSQAGYKRRSAPLEVCQKHPTFPCQPFRRGYNNLLPGGGLQANLRCFMPVYTYRCTNCGFVFDQHQKFSDISFDEVSGMRKEDPPEGLPAGWDRLQRVWFLFDRPPLAIRAGSYYHQPKAQREQRADKSDRSDRSDKSEKSPASEKTTESPSKSSSSSEK